MLAVGIKGPIETVDVEAAHTTLVRDGILCIRGDNSDLIFSRCLFCHFLYPMCLLCHSTLIFCVHM
jgi:hypothetical protein